MHTRILVIDDDRKITELLRRGLGYEGYIMDLAHSGPEGLTLAREHAPDLVILDIMMEKSDTGFDVARELKNDPPTKNIPILMLTAIKEKTGLDFKKEAGDMVWLPVADYVEKPLKPEELISKVEKLLK